MGIALNSSLPPLPAGKECLMRNEMIQTNLLAPRSGDRINAATLPFSGLGTASLGTEAIRLARLAASIHLDEAARLRAASPADRVRDNRTATP